MVLQTPRVRPDLQPTPLEDEGIRYVDVWDPRSGVRMRMYEFEWRVAEKMDGVTSFDELAEWTKSSLELPSNAEDLVEYARRLNRIGFFEPVLNPEDLQAREPTLQQNLSIQAPAPVFTPPDPIESEKTTRSESPSARMGAAPPPPPPPPIPQTAAVAPRPNRPSRPSIALEPPTSSTLPPLDWDVSPTRKRGWSWALLLIVIVAIAAGALFVHFSRSVTMVQVALASPREVVRFHPSPAPLRGTEPQTLSFGESGRVAMVVSVGTEAQPETVLAALENYAKLSKELADVRDRLGFYERQRATAESKGNADEVSKSQAKVDEKKAALAVLEAHVAKVRITGSHSGTVSQVTVKPGQQVEAGAPAVTVTAQRLLADFPVDGEVPKEGEMVLLQKAQGSAGALQGKVVHAAKAGNFTVEVNAEKVPLKAGESVRLVQKREKNTIVLPQAAVVQQGSNSFVFVLIDGVARLRRVQVIPSGDPKEAWVSQGLATGDSVIVSAEKTLRDGEHVASH